MPCTDTEWQALLARGKEVRRLATIYAEAELPVAFNKGGIKYLVSRDLDTHGSWRVTYFTREGEPAGHWVTNTALDAFLEVLNGTAEPIGRNHPRKAGTFRVIQVDAGFGIRDADTSNDWGDAWGRLFTTPDDAERWAWACHEFKCGRRQMLPDPSEFNCIERA